jgi:hypothetical protein
LDDVNGHNGGPRDCSMPPLYRNAGAGRNACSLLRPLDRPLRDFPCLMLKCERSEPRSTHNGGASFEAQPFGLRTTEPPLASPLAS